MSNTNTDISTTTLVAIGVGVALFLVLCFWCGCREPTKPDVESDKARPNSPGSSPPTGLREVVVASETGQMPVAVTAAPVSGAASNGLPAPAPAASRPTSVGIPLLSAGSPGPSAVDDSERIVAPAIFAPAVAALDRPDTSSPAPSHASNAYPGARRVTMTSFHGMPMNVMRATSAKLAPASLASAGDDFLQQHRSEFDADEALEEEQEEQEGGDGGNFLFIPQPSAADFEPTLERNPQRAAAASIVSRGWAAGATPAPMAAASTRRSLAPPQMSSMVPLTASTQMALRAHSATASAAARDPSNTQRPMTLALTLGSPQPASLGGFGSSTTYIEETPEPDEAERTPGPEYVMREILRLRAMRPPSEVVVAGSDRAAAVDAAVPIVVADAEVPAVAMVEAAVVDSAVGDPTPAVSPAVGGNNTRRTVTFDATSPAVMHGTMDVAVDVRGLQLSSEDDEDDEDDIAVDDNDNDTADSSSRNSSDVAAAASKAQMVAPVQDEEEDDNVPLAMSVPAATVQSRSN
ncbi:hypothetical protein BC828DRAFT_403157 [Blastocladiella britannica]|nr:hypothetical protein BC828DRAFT_403157 [Blastocladiella britannica]